MQRFISHDTEKDDAGPYMLVTDHEAALRSCQAACRDALAEKDAQIAARDERCESLIAAYDTFVARAGVLIGGGR